MQRRNFISVVGQSALTAAISNACSPEQSLPDSSQLVGTPEKHAAYLEKMLKALCADLGPRPVGSEVYNQASEYFLLEETVSGFSRKTGTFLAYDTTDLRILMKTMVTSMNCEIVGEKIVWR